MSDGDDNEQTAPGVPQLKPMRCRLTVLETVYHSAPDEQPTQSERHYSRVLVTDEQPYGRRLTATQEWQLIDSGWLEECSLMVLANEEGRSLQKVPTPEERLEIESKVIEVSAAGDGPESGGVTRGEWLVHPGESMRATPVDVTKLRIRCLAGKAKATLTLYPR